jgi:hypothetical protein
MTPQKNLLNLFLTGQIAAFFMVSGLAWLLPAANERDKSVDRLGREKHRQLNPGWSPVIFEYLAYGTGSKPPGCQGWHRVSRLADSQRPLTNP